MCVEGRQLTVEPVAPVRLRDFRRDPLAQAGCVVGQAARTSARFEIDLRLEIGRAEVAVDEPRDVLVEA